MFHDPESSYSEIKRRMRGEQVHMQQAASAVRYAHSRTGLMARFLQRMADPGRSDRGGKLAKGLAD